MIIQNYSALAKDPSIARGLQILTAGLESAMPQKELKKIFNSKTIRIGKKRIKLSNYDSIHLVAFGKAANSMTKAVDSIVQIKNGIEILNEIMKYIFNFIDILLFLFPFVAT